MNITIVIHFITQVLIIKFAENFVTLVGKVLLKPEHQTIPQRNGVLFYPLTLLKCVWKQNYKDIQMMMMVMVMTMICCLDWEVLSKHNMVHSKPIIHLPWLDSHCQWQISLLVLLWRNRSQAFCIQLSVLLLTVHCVCLLSVC